ncbi:MAG: 2-hydroxyglutaryl-CoA dehydratase [Ruminococcaceae bacterium]|nr:2-hydroxyglutaryl-CoA dehydratase [Oscillospiraceae bacterium]
MSDKKLPYIQFTKEMKKDYTILMPTMLSRHFKLIERVLRNRGYNAHLLDNVGPEVIETGLKYVHNDTCYPAILVIGQFISALQSGRYDVNKTALVYFQTGGGCRASNYIFLLRKALERAGFSNIPVISLSFSGIEKHPGLKFGVSLIRRLFNAIIYGDMLLTLVNQCKPYEINKGDSERLAEELTEKLADGLETEGLSFKKVKKNCQMMLDRFAEIPVNKTPKIRVGVVGEIYVKYSPLGNNNLEQFLVDEGAEVVMPGLIDFFLYSFVSMITDYTLYGMKWLNHAIAKVAYKYISSQQNKIIELMRNDGRFEAATPISHTISLIEEYMGIGTKMGEGWLLPAEMLELNDKGVHNIICTQPFGCLPNHICGKGMMKPLKDRNPEMNIVAIDYDAGATKVNQENRIKLMLANARENLEAQNNKQPLKEREFAKTT